MKKTWMVIAALAALCAACDDSDQKTCVEGYAACDPSGMILTRCVDGYLMETTCPATHKCDASKAQCVVAEVCNNYDMPVCEEFTDPTTQVRYSRVKRCVNNVYEYEDCGTNGCLTLNSSGNPVPAYCADPNKRPESGACIDGESRCLLSGMHQTCANGVWADSPCCPKIKMPDGTEQEDPNCSKTCQGGVCKSTCIEGAKRCADDMTVQHCADGKWITENVCSGSGIFCADGKCVDKNTYDPKPGTECGGFVSSCANNIYKFCDNGFVKEEPCVNNRQCVTMKDSSSTCAYNTDGNLSKTLKGMADKCSAFATAEKDVNLLPLICENNGLTAIQCIRDNQNKMSFALVGNMQSVCTTDSSGKAAAAWCNGKTTTPVLSPCTECSNLEQKSMAVCDGEMKESAPLSPAPDTEFICNEMTVDWNKLAVDFCDSIEPDSIAVCSRLVDEESDSVELINCMSKCKMSEVDKASKTECSDDKYIDNGGNIISVTDTYMCKEVADGIAAYVIVDQAVCADKCAASGLECNEKGSGSGGNGGASDWFNCHDTEFQGGQHGRDICADHPGTTAVCMLTSDNRVSVSCSESCAASDVSRTRTTCEDGLDGGNGQKVSAAITETCTEMKDLDGNNPVTVYVIADEESDIAICVDKCNAGKDSCNDKGVVDQGGGNGENDPLYNCSDEEVLEGQTGAQVCADEPGTVAVCDSQYISCLDPCSASEIGNKISKCALDTEVNASLTIDSVCTAVDSSTHVYVEDLSKIAVCKGSCNTQKTSCDAKGSEIVDASGGGNGGSGNGGGNDYGLLDCSNASDGQGHTGKDICNAEDPGTVAVCTADMQLMCLDSCTAAQVNQTKDKCIDTPDEGSFVLPGMQCIAIENGVHAYVPLRDGVDCATVCNANHTACK